MAHANPGYRASAYKIECGAGHILRVVGEKLKQTSAAE